MSAHERLAIALEAKIESEQGSISGTFYPAETAAKHVRVLAELCVAQGKALDTIIHWIETQEAP